MTMTEMATYCLDFAVATDIGCHRENNQDSFGYDAGQNLYVVCDGMGGNAGGEVASATAVRVLIESFEAAGIGSSYSQDAQASSLSVDMRLLRSIQEANRAVHEVAEVNPRLSGMGTTLVCACQDGNRILVGNVGDSRAYIVRDGACLQITLDHSLLDEQVRQGLITPEMAAVSGLQSVITRAVGVAETVEPDLFAAELKPHDLMVLASDGLTRYVHADEIAAIASEQHELTGICQRLIDQAKQRGGADNITCMLLRAVERSGGEAATAA